MPQTPLQSRRRVRRHRVPYPLTDSAELFEGGEILREFGGDIAVVLWKSYKNVMLWAEARPDERGGLFAEGAARRRRGDIGEMVPASEIAAPLLSLAELLDAPGAVRPEAVTRACREISEWAAGREGSSTALLFMQSAALADPRDAAAACAVGRMARDRAEYARAETWFRQAIVAAREVADWPTYTRSYLGLAKVFWQRGALPTARKCILRAYRTATRHHLAELRGFALWDLGGIAVQGGRWEEACSYIRGALRIYGPAHMVSLRLVNDIAFAWMSRGWFAPASRVLGAVAPQAEDRTERLILNGSLARAAGGAGEEGLLRQAVAEIRRLSVDPAVAAVVPDAWLDVAHGAASVRNWELAEWAAETSLRLATERGEARVRFDAEATLDSVRAGRAIQEVAGSEPALPESIAALAEDLALLAEMGSEADTPLVGASAS